MQINVTGSARKRAIRWISCLLLLTFFITMLTSCSSMLIGTYSQESYGVEETFEFKPFGKVVYSMGEDYVEGTYKIEGNKITFSFEGMGLVTSFLNDTFNFVNNGDSIEIDGDIYIKK